MRENLKLFSFEKETRPHSPEYEATHQNEEHAKVPPKADVRREIRAELHREEWRYGDLNQGLALPHTTHRLWTRFTTMEITTPRAPP